MKHRSGRRSTDDTASLSKNGRLVYLRTRAVRRARRYFVRASGRKVCRARVQRGDAVTAVADTWRVNIRGVGSLKKRGTSSGARSFVKSSRACSLFESLIKEVAVPRSHFLFPFLLPSYFRVFSSLFPSLALPPFFPFSLFFFFFFFFFYTELARRLSSLNLKMNLRLFNG